MGRKKSALDMAIKGIRDGNGGVIIPGQKLPFVTEGAQETSWAFACSECSSVGWDLEISNIGRKQSTMCEAHFTWNPGSS